MVSWQIGMQPSAGAFSSLISLLHHPHFLLPDSPSDAAALCWVCAAHLLQVADTPFARCSYTQGIELLQKAIAEGHKFEDMVRHTTRLLDGGGEGAQPRAGADIAADVQRVRGCCATYDAFPVTTHCEAAGVLDQRLLVCALPHPYAACLTAHKHTWVCSQKRAHASGRTGGLTSRCMCVSLTHLPPPPGCALGH